jgi:CheY-like chemotaxis protein
VTRTALKGGKPTVLVVDDNTDAVEALAQILEYEGYAVATAYDGREALDYLGGHPPPDLIVLDLMMPVMNGWELRAELAKVPAFAKVPIVVMTALAEAAEIEADAIVAKPIDLKRLLLIMDRLLARRADTDGSMSRA